MDTAVVSIPLTQGKVALIDADDRELIEGYSWRALKSLHTWYAITDGRSAGKSRTIYMHRLIVGASEGSLTDHRNHDGLDNRRQNLRICHYWQNNAHGRKRRSATRFRGVFPNKGTGRWMARVGRNYLGYFATPELAAAAYNAAALERFGEFACLNVLETR